MDALENLDAEVYQRLDHGLVFKELGEFELDGNYYRFNCPNCEKNQIRAKSTFFARVGLPYGHCGLCRYRASWWGKFGAGPHDVRRFARLLGLSGESLTPEAQDSLRKALRHALLMEELAYFTTVSLLEDTHAEALAYLYAKGFSMEEIKEAELGYYPSCEKVKEYMLSKGYSLDELEEAGVLAPDLGTQYKLVLPYRSEAGRVLGMLAYGLIGGAVWPDRRLFCSTVVTAPFHLNIALRSNEFEALKRLVVVDEPLEAAMLGPLGVTNAISPADVKLSNETLSLLKRYGVKELVFSLREASLEKIDALATAVARTEGIGLYFVELKGGGDLIRYIRSSGYNAWKELLKKTVALPKGVPAGETMSREAPTVGLKEGLEVTLKEERPGIKSKGGSALIGREKPVAAPKEVSRAVGPPGGPTPFSTKEVLERATKRQRLKSGYPGLDKLPVFSQDELALIVGEQGCGKTLLVLNLLLNMMCHHDDFCFALFSSEAAEHLTFVRLLGILSDVPFSQVEGELKKGEHTLEVKKGLDLLKGMGLEERFYFFGRPDLHPEVIFSCAKGVPMKGKPLGAIFIDGMPLLREGQDAQDTSGRLKAMRMLAETLHAGVICTLATGATGGKGLADLGIQQPYAGTILRLSTPEGGSDTAGGQKGLVINVLRPSGGDTFPPVKLYIKPSGKIVEPV